MKAGRLEHSFLDILRALNAAKVRYLVAGGVAVILHGVVRTTHDLDLYIDLAEANLLKAVRTLESLGFRPRAPVAAEAIADAGQRAKWIREKNMKVFTLLIPSDPLHPVDVFISHPIPFQEAWKRRALVAPGRVRIPFLSVEDLITLKRIAGRDQDRSDIISLRRLGDAKS